MQTINQSSGERKSDYSLFLIGMFALISYLTAEILGGYISPNYNYFDNTASELMAIGSSDRHYFIPFYFLHAIFIGLFGSALLTRYSYLKNPSIYTGGILLLTLGVSYALACTIYPMDPPDTPYTSSGYLHITFIGTGAISLLCSIPIITQGVYKEYNWIKFKRYTWFFLPLIIICGILSPIILYTDTALMGLAERIIGYLSSLWLLTLSYGLMKQPTKGPAISHESTQAIHSNKSEQGLSNSGRQNVY